MKLYYLKWFLPIFFICNSVFADAPAVAGKDKAMICSACHGQDGVSTNPLWPHLAGQHAKYLIKQLQDYKGAKIRNEPTMSALVRNLSDTDIKDISNFYAVLPKASCKQKQDSSLRGKEIYQRGDMQKRITACIACHGPDGVGNAQAGFPLIAGQNPQYTVSQLQAFKNKSRINDISAIMQDITSHMSPQDMQAVADYICSLD